MPMWLAVLGTTTRSGLLDGHRMNSIEFLVGRLAEHQIKS